MSSERDKNLGRPIGRGYRFFGNEVTRGFGNEVTKGREFFDNGIEEDGLTLTSTRLARLLGLGRSTFYRKVKSGEIDIPFIMLGAERRYLLDTVKDWLKDKEVRPMAPKKRYRSIK